MTRIHTVGKIRDDPSDQYHPCALHEDVFYPARRGLAVGWAAAVEAREGEGAGIGERGRFLHLSTIAPKSCLFTGCITTCTERRPGLYQSDWQRC